MDNEPKRNPSAGAAMGALSAAKNKKIMTVAGGILIAVGIAGMVMMGSQAMEVIRSQAFGGETLFWFLMRDYAFMFTMIAGLGLVIYSQVSLQREGAKRREDEAKRRRSSNNNRTNADAAA